jgi:membrane associated rhomboid family serine protease
VGNSAGHVPVAGARLEGIKRFILINCTIFVGLTLLNGFYSRGIDNAAHVGGVVSGIVLGMLLTWFDGSRDRSA